MSLYKLQHKNDMVAIMEMDSEGRFITKVDVREKELLPLQAWNDMKGLTRWWEQRQVPMNQGGLKELLEYLQISSSAKFLIKNLGLSLNDCYWIQPIEENFRWEEINLFSNDFQSFDIRDEKDRERLFFTPTSSTGGELAKRWIVQNNKRMLIKGNQKGSSIQQSLNEVFASRFHELQGFNNYVEYKMTPFKLTDRKLEQKGCISENFASEKLEFIPGIQVVESTKKRNDVSWFEHYISVCVQHGIEEKVIREFMDYMICTDFIMTNVDRHFMNFGVLRDSDSLQFVKPAPIFDSGNSMFYRERRLPDLDDIEINSFVRTEKKQLKYVRSKNLVDISRLPSEQILEEVYVQDEESPVYLSMIKEGYQKKIKMFKEWQQK
ncbi:hypothetical protein P261_00554 [Lachnospiraceae bacterium TWA4]|nr:hypothetical protein P261_00554 [Lachnospiraceae bacterium TWA4]